MGDDPILNPEDYAELKLLLQEHGRRKRRASPILIQKGMNTLECPEALEAVHGLTSRKQRLGNAQASKPEAHKEAPTEPGSQHD